jgi:hypothetical protein
MARSGRGALVRASLALAAVLFGVSDVSSASSSSSPPSQPASSPDDDPFSCVYSAADEASALACLSDAASFSSADKDDAARAVEHLIGRAFYESSTRLIEMAGSQGLDVTTAVHQSTSKVRNKLTALTDALGKAATAAGIPPAFEWAQSPDSIFLNGA